MKIGVVSDTHSKNLPQQMLQDFQHVDFIIHAGDFCSLDILKELKKIKEVKAVYGNMDETAIRSVLSPKEIIDIDNIRIGVCHGAGAPGAVLNSVQKIFEGEDVHAIIFGHSHHPTNEMIDGVLYFNPGSPNDTVFAPYCSYGILDVTDKVIGTIVEVE